MDKDGKPSGVTDALAMLDLFASVGATRADLTLTTSDGVKDSFRRNVGLKDLRRALPDILEAAIDCGRNVILRPHGPGVGFIQLDDLKTDTLSHVAPAVFLALETSPGNFQGWLALKGEIEKDFARRLRKGTGADPTASGATRIAGSLNFKDKYAPNFPRVTMHAQTPGRFTTTSELAERGLVAPAEPLPEFRERRPARARDGSRKWPSYAICLERAPLNSEGSGPDTSHADISWCMIAISWGWGVQECARRLLEEPESKAFQRGERYAETTARNAALYVQQRRQRETSTAMRR